MSWYGPLPLDGSATQVLLARNNDGRVEAFFIGENGHLYHTWQIAPNSLEWSPASALAGASALQIAVGRNVDGRLELFYVGKGNHLFHNWQTAPADWQDPATVNSWAGETSFVKQSASYVAAGETHDGRIEIFYAGTGGDLYHDWQTAPADAANPSSKLNSWNGETPFPGRKAKQIAVGSNVDGRLEIFYVGGNNHLFHNWQTKSPIAGDSSTFDLWAGETAFVKVSANHVSVAPNVDGRLEIFYADTGDHLCHNWQLAPADASAGTSDLNAWQGTTAFAGNSARQIAPIRDATGRIQIFYVGTNNHLFQNAQKQPTVAVNGVAPNAWDGEQGILKGKVDEVAIASDLNGQLELVYIASDKKLHIMPQRSGAATPLGSNFNQFLTSNCQVLSNVSVVINISEDLVSTFATGSPGFGFQLNAFSENGQNCVWQQYCIGLTGKKLVGTVNNWSKTGKAIIDKNFTLTSLADAKLPAGFQLSFSLGMDANGNVRSAGFAVFDENANPLAEVNKDVLELAHGHTSNIAPITGLQVVLVGFDNSECAFLSTGGGTIIYDADQAMVPASSLNGNCTAAPQEITEEIANSVYTPVEHTRRELAVWQQGFSVGLTSDQLAKSPRD